MPFRDRAKRLYHRAKDHVYRPSRGNTPEPPSIAPANDPESRGNPLPSSSVPDMLSNESPRVPVNLDYLDGTTNLSAQNLTSATLVETAPAEGTHHTHLDPTRPVENKPIGSAPPVPPGAENASATTPLPDQANPLSLGGTSNKSTPNINPRTATLLAVPGPAETLLSPATQAPSNTLTPTAYPVEQQPTSVTNPPAAIEKNSTKMAWSGLTALGQVLKASASTFGPLKSALEGISGCVEIFEVCQLVYLHCAFILLFRNEQRASDAREEYKTLGIELDSLLMDLTGYFDLSAAPTITSSINSLAGSVGYSSS
jgi:hypothetical protein